MIPIAWDIDATLIDSEPLRHVAVVELPRSLIANPGISRSRG